MAFDSEQLAHLHFIKLFSSGEISCVSLRDGVRRARFRLMSDVDAGIDAVLCRNVWNTTTQGGACKEKIIMYYVEMCGIQLL